MSKQKNVPPYLDSIGRYLGMATGATNVVTNSLLSKHDLTIQHWIVLTALWRQEGLSISDIATYYRVNTPAASRIIGRMRDAGWVTTKVDENDKRATQVYLTEKSKKLNHLLDMYLETNDTLLAGFSDAEIAQLKDMLTRMAKNGFASKKGRPTGRPD